MSRISGMAQDKKQQKQDEQFAEQVARIVEKPKFTLKDFYGEMKFSMDQMSSGRSTDGDSTAPNSVEIPPIEKRVSPEEYRRLLLEGMQGDVPDEYQAMKKKYDEELVAQ